jgi:hypothetical protein
MVNLDEFGCIGPAELNLDELEPNLNRKKNGRAYAEGNAVGIGPWHDHMVEPMPRALPSA